jgi:hypothetical protein
VALRHQLARPGAPAHPKVGARAAGGLEALVTAWQWQFFRQERRRGTHLRTERKTTCKRNERSGPALFFKRDGSASSQYIPASEMAPLQQFSTKHKYKWNGTALFHLTPQPNATLEMGERPTPAQPGSIKRNKKNKVITVHNLHTPIQP